MNRSLTVCILRRVAPLLALTFAASASAEPTPQDKALAQGLFDDGRALMEAGRIPEACAKLAESHRLDPSAGTVLNLALCHEKEGKTASAWAEFKEAAALSAASGRQDRVEYAQKKAAALEAKRSLLVLELAAHPEGMVIRLNDKELRAAAAAGSGMPLDPGEYRIEATAPGKKAWSSKLTIQPGPSTARVVIPALADAPKSGGLAPSATPSAGDASQGSGWRAAGFAIGGLGIAGLAVGGVFGGLTLAAAAEVKEGCDDGCSEDDVEKNDAARTTALVSNIGFGAGAACVAAGLVLVLTVGSPKKSAAAPRVWAAPQVGAGVTGLSVGGHW